MTCICKAIAYFTMSGKIFADEDQHHRQKPKLWRILNENPDLHAVFKSLKQVRSFSLTMRVS